MIVSEVALRSWTRLPEREILINDLTMLGLEVDGVEPVAPEFSNVVVGEVVECEQHPNADKLRVTKVNVGNDQLLNIVCGAPNCRKGLKVCVAQIGAVLPGNFEIKEAELRGVPSQGMLCSFSELGINIEQEGIIELDADAVIGQDVRRYLALDDVTIEIGLTANRADCNSQLGVARDLAAFYGVETHMEHFKKNVYGVDYTVNPDDIFPVRIENTQACPVYISRVIRDVNVNAKTPDWMVQALHRYGVRSIDPIVDITNYVLHMLGQPMHAFDLEQLHDTIVVRNARDNEKLVLLSGEEVELSSDVLVIADEQRPLALAGIFGGQDSGINSNTKDIVLEIAHFAPLAIINKARRFGLHTDASHRFERGVDPQMVELACEFATALVVNICGGKPGKTNLVGEIPNNRKEITLSHALVDRIAGMPFAPSDVEVYLKRLGCEVTVDGDKYHVVTPSWRFDLAIEEDLVEEVIRLYGYQNIPVETPLARLSMREHHEVDVDLNSIKEVLINRDFQEVITYSFVDPNLQKYFHEGEDALTLPNPISVEMSQMRLSLFTNLLNTLAYNQKRQNKRVRIFETGLTFIPDASCEAGVNQKPVLAGLIAGDNYRTNWSVKDQEIDFFTLKGVVEDVLAKTHSHFVDDVEFKKANIKGFHPGQTAVIYINGREQGVIGKLHPSLHKPFEVSGDIFLFSLDCEALTVTHIPQITAVTKYQANKRDIALFVAKDIAVGDVLKAAKNAATTYVQDVELFDVYAAEGSDNKSIALTLTIASDAHTLSDKEIADEVNVIVEVLKANFNAAFRGGR